MTNEVSAVAVREFAHASVSSQQRRGLAGLLLLALVLRLGWVLLVDPEPKLDGGDGPFYLYLADQLANGMGLRYGEPTAVVGPVYPTYLAGLQLMFGKVWVVEGARVGQAIIGVALTALLFAVGSRWRGPQVGLAAAGLAAVDFRLIVESGSIYTESLLSALLMLSLWLYVVSLERDKGYWWVLTGAVLGITTLTRGVVQLLPLVLLAHLGAQRTGWGIWRDWGWLLVGFMLVVSPWMIRNWLLFGSPKIAHGGAAHFWMGARGDGRSLRKDEMMIEIDALRIEDGGIDRYSYLADAARIISSDPWRFVQIRARRVAGAYLQPYGTVTVGVVLGNKSIKAMLPWDSWRSLGEVVVVPTFWPKLWIYILHFGSIGLAILYVLMRWWQWREWSIFAIPVLYFSGVYALLTIIPRYLFPIMPLYLLLAAGALVEFKSIVFETKRIHITHQSASTPFPPKGSSA